MFRKIFKALHVSKQRQPIHSFEFIPCLAAKFTPQIMQLVSATHTLWRKHQYRKQVAPTSG